MTWSRCGASPSPAAATSPPTSCGACWRPAHGHPGRSNRQDALTRRRRDAALLSLLYASGLRRAEAVALELADIDQITGLLRVRQGKGRKPRPVSLPASALPALQDWLEARGSEPGPLFCPVLKNGRLVRDPQGQLQGLSGSAA